MSSVEVVCGLMRPWMSVINASKAELSLRRLYSLIVYCWWSMANFFCLSCTSSVCVWAWELICFAVVVLGRLFFCRMLYTMLHVVSFGISRGTEMLMYVCLGCDNVQYFRDKVSVFGSISIKSYIGIVQPKDKAVFLRKLSANLKSSVFSRQVQIFAYTTPSD